MLDVFAYPVSGVMKLWHILLHSLFGVPEHLAWVLCLFGLVLTVRGIMIPLSWMQYRAGRVASLLRPRTAAIRAEYAAMENITAADLKEQNARLKALNKEYNFSPAAGCLTGLVSVPAFMGLYRVIARMARPNEGVDANWHAPIGLLSGEDVSEFLQATYYGVPLPTYSAMSPEQFQILGTTPEALSQVMMPILYGAIIFTTGNMAFSVYRTLQTLDHANGAARFTLKLLVVMVVFVPITLFTSARSGIIPLAIILYWFANNLWTVTQTVILHFILEKKYPLDELYKSHSAERKELRRQELAKKRAFKKRRRHLRLGYLRKANRLELKELKAEQKAKKIAAKAAAKERKNKVRLAQAELSRTAGANGFMAKQEARLKERKARKLGITVAELEDQMAENARKP
ncbi:membrane protein insertase YidC [Corynebacterium caspium]|uniref:membrane protein insertase YidC n=1 Tax=Corynebacterium caspium TaxID=234828 RepID=UPI00037AB86E|nr:membrane protein insertase YidC [Corynebacterium caspium]WKD60014.1 putative inner membrane protein translocase component YidC [Corynebacterium caspium DSM 44850]